MIRFTIAIIILSAPQRGTAATWSETLDALKNLNSPNACVADGRRSPLICRDPVRAVCRGREASHRATKASLMKTLKDQSKTISDGFQKWMKELDIYQKTNRVTIPESLRTAHQKHLGNLEKVNDVILAEYGLNRKDLERVYAQVNATVVEAAQGFGGLDQTSMKKELLNQLKRTRLLTPADFHQGDPTNNDVLDCGSDGLAANAYHISRAPGPGVFLCPGFLMLSLKQAGGDLDSLSGVIAHEIGHAIDGRSVPVPQPSGESFRLDSYKKAYQSYWECMSKLVKRHGSKFISLSETMEYYSKHLPLLERSSQKSPDLSKQLNEIIEMTKQHKQFPSRFPADPMSIELLKSELIADSYMGMALEKKAQGLDRSKQEEFLVKNLKLFCADHTPEGFPKRLDALDPVHPPTEYRIEQTLMQPSVRALLGCPVVDADKRPCSLIDLP
jgi:hypothetical protein